MVDTDNPLPEDILKFVTLNYEPGVILSIFDNYLCSLNPQEKIISRNAFLCLAVQETHHALVSALLNQGYPVNVESPWPGRILPLPLHTACEEGNALFIKTLLDHGANANRTGRGLGKINKPLCSAIELVLKHDEPYLLDILSPQFESNWISQGWTLTHLACKHGAIRCLRHIFKTSTADINTANACGVTPLSWALNGNKALLQILLENGADVNMKNKYGWSVMYVLLHPFSWGVQPNLIPHDLVGTVQQLVKAGINVNDLSPKKSGFQMLCCQIRALFGHGRDSEYPFCIESHQADVKTLAKLFLSSESYNPDETIDNIHCILSEIRSCTERFAQPFINKASPELIANFRKTFDLERAFLPYCQALSLACDLLYMLLTIPNHTTQCSASQATRQLNDILACISANTFNISLLTHHDWAPIAAILFDVLHLMVLQLWPLPFDPIEVTELPLDENHLLTVKLILNVLSQKSYAHYVNKVSQEPKYKDYVFLCPPVRRIETLTKLSILKKIPVPRIQQIHALPIPKYLRSHLCCEVL